MKKYLIKLLRITGLILALYLGIDLLLWAGIPISERGGGYIVGFLAGGYWQYLSTANSKTK
jgi:hypothetical protein